MEGWACRIKLLAFGRHRVPLMSSSHVVLRYERAEACSLPATQSDRWMELSTQTVGDEDSNIQKSMFLGLFNRMKLQTQSSPCSQHVGALRKVPYADGLAKDF